MLEEEVGDQYGFAEQSAWGCAAEVAQVGEYSVGIRRDERRPTTG